MVIAGLLLGIAGVALLAAGDGIWGGLVTRAMLIGSALVWAIGTLVVRRAGGAPLPRPNPPPCSWRPVRWRCSSRAWRSVSRQAGVCTR